MSRGVYVSVFLQLSSSVPGHRSSQYTYQIQMKNQSGSVFEREFTSEFEAGECWGYNRFFQLDRLDQYIEHNQLRFIFYVRWVSSWYSSIFYDFIENRATSYATQQRDLNNYVKHLEGTGLYCFNLMPVLICNLRICSILSLQISTEVI